MQPTQTAHVSRVRHLRESFAAANERLVARLRGASDEAAERSVPSAWSAAQIGWHVATVSTRFAAMIAGDIMLKRLSTCKREGAAMRRTRPMFLSRQSQNLYVQAITCIYR